MAGLGWPEIAIILVILVLLFGAKKLPELARGGGRALRIFKAETHGLMGDDDEEGSAKTDAQREIDAHNRQETAQRFEQPGAEAAPQPASEAESRPEARRDTDA
ncbi:MAG TPA: Sec-independent protein translocase subunit TatA [Nocardioidaceae bacterium]|nr:Sec-independent protein translocase subunit TatA [Nocardioidaceae bacterium]